MAVPNVNPSSIAHRSSIPLFFLHFFKVSKNILGWHNDCFKRVYLKGAESKRMIMVSQEEWKRAIENGSEAMLQALNTFGPSETLNLLVCFSNNDPVVNQLLLKYPSVVAAGEFLSRMLVCKNRNNKAKGKIKVKRVNDGKRKAKNEESFTPEGVVKALNEPQDSLHLSSEENSRLLNVNVKENHEK